MQRVRRSRMSASDKAAIWERWTRGESLSEIGRAVDRVPAAVFHVVRARGGIPPPPRWRSSRALTVSEREEISRGLAMGVSFRQLAVRLGRPTSTVSREVGRHGGRRGYRAARADAATWNRALRPQRCRLAQRPILCALCGREARGGLVAATDRGMAQADPSQGSRTCRCRTRRFSQDRGDVEPISPAQVFH